MTIEKVRRRRKHVIKSRTAFKRWLLVQPHQARYMPFDVCRCPLATYCGGRVSSGYWRKGCGTEPIDLPAWAESLRMRVDQIPGAVSPKKVLELLEAIQ